MIRLGKWDIGISIQHPGQKGMNIYLWFYEWRMFDAVEKGEHTHGRADFPWAIGDDGSEAHAEIGGIRPESVRACPSIWKRVCDAMPCP